MKKEVMFDTNKLCRKRLRQQEKRTLTSKEDRRRKTFVIRQELNPGPRTPKASTLPLRHHRCPILQSLIDKMLNNAAWGTQKSTRHQQSVAHTIKHRLRQVSPKLLLIKTFSFCQRQQQTFSSSPEWSLLDIFPVPCFAPFGHSTIQ